MWDLKWGVPIDAAAVKQMNKCGDKGAKLQGNALNLSVDIQTLIYGHEF